MEIMSQNAYTLFEGGGVVCRTTNWVVGGGVDCTQKWGEPTCSQKPRNSGHPLGMFLAASLNSDSTRVNLITLSSILAKVN